MSSTQVARAIAAGWEQIAATVGTRLVDFEAELIRLLRAIDERMDDAQLVDQVFALFDRYPGATAILREQLARAGATVSKGNQTQAVFETHERYVSVAVFYGTSREATGSAEPASFFGGGRANNSFGVVRVSIPDDHRMGALEKPRWFTLEFRADPAKHVLLLSVEPLDRAAFAARARAALGAADKHEALVFVHGYNVTFEDAARRAAQLAYDLNFEGVPALYSWPSEGALLSYAVDANNAEWAVPHFRDFLQLVRQQTGAEAVHVIAHSMGTRLLARALADPIGEGGRLRQVVFAAPDIDADTFRQLSDAFKGKCERVTLYASSGDRALEVSEKYQKYPRAGQSGLGLVIVPTVDTIDASAIKTEFMGHSYFGASDSVISDLFYLVRNGTPPGARARLLERQRYGASYWEFRPV
jgi:esterase/lipase superfamily enzyme